MVDNFNFNLEPAEDITDQDNVKNDLELEMDPDNNPDDNPEVEPEEVLDEESNFNFNLEPSNNTEMQKIRIFQDGLDREPEVTSIGGFGIAADMIGGAAVGVGNAIEETYDGLQTLAGVDEETIAERNLIPEFYKPKTAAGQLTEGASRFLTGFIPANRVLKSVGWNVKPGASTISNTMRVGSRGLTAGAIADFNVWDPHEGRLSDMLIEFDSPILNNAVTQYLASDPNDTLAEGRLKNVLEGMMIGLPLELFLGIRSIKKARAAKTVEEKNKIYEEDGKAIQESVEKNTKVQDDEIRLFHGSSKSIKNLDPDRSLYLTDNADYAKQYTDPNYSAAAKTKEDFENLDPTIYNVTIKKDEVFDTTIPEHKKIFDEFDETFGNMSGLTSKGYPDWTDAENLKEFFKEKGYKFKAAIVDEGGGGFDPTTQLPIKNRGLSHVVYDHSIIKEINGRNPLTDALRKKLVEDNPGINVQALLKKFKKQKEKDKQVKAAHFDDLNGKPVRPNADGTITVYHRTDVDLAEIEKSKTFKSKERDDVYVSTTKDGAVEGYGKNVIEVRIPQEKLIIDDAYPSGEVHFRVKIKDINKAYFNPVKSEIKEIELLFEDLFNIQAFKNSDDMTQTIEDILRTIDDDAKNILTQGRLSNDIAEAIAKQLARDPDEIMAMMPKITEFSREFPIRLLAHKMMIQMLNKEYIRLAKIVDEHTIKYGDEKISLDMQDAFKHFPESAKQDVLDFMTLEEAMRDFIVQLKEQISNSSAALNVGKVKVGPEEAQFSIDKLLDIRSRYKHNPLKRAKEAKNLKPDDVPDKVAEVKAHRITEGFNALYINSLLSGVVTNVINFGVGFFETFLRPLEQIAGGALTGNQRARALGYNQYIGMMRSFLDIWSAAGKAFWRNQAILDAQSQTIDAFRVSKQGKRLDPLDPDYWNITKGTGRYTVAQVIGRILGLPSNVLTTADELLKQANYRGRIYAELVDGLISSGVEKGSKVWNETLEKGMKDAFNADGSAATKNNPVAEESLKYSRTNLFQDDLANGSWLNWGSSLQRFFNEQPSLRWIAPFIRTPTNLWRHAGDRIPGMGLATRRMRDLWNSGDPNKRAEVVGRQFFGIAVTTTAVSLANDYVLINEEESKKGANPIRLPKLTGRGSRDPDEKQALLAAGWRPYSILTQNDDGSYSYKQYNRMDPRFFIFGIIADISYVMDRNPDLTLFDSDQKYNADKDLALLSDLISETMVSIMVNITDKSYTKGISDTIGILTDPKEYKLQRVVGNLIGGAIPFSALRKQMREDQNAYDLRGLTDKVLDGLGATGSLEYKRDIFGDPIIKDKTTIYSNEGVSSLIQAPYLVGRVGDNLNETPSWLNKLAGLEVPLALPDATSLNPDLDLTTYKRVINGKEQTALDYWREQISKVEGNDGKIKQGFAALINSDDFKESGQGDKDKDGGKEMQVKKLYKQYKDLAKEQMLEKFPELYDDLEKANTDRYMYIEKDSPTVDKLRTY